MNMDSDSLICLSWSSKSDKSESSEGRVALEKCLNSRSSEFITIVSISRNG